MAKSIRDIGPFWIVESSREIRPLFRLAQAKNGFPGAVVSTMLSLELQGTMDKGSEVLGDRENPNRLDEYAPRQSGWRSESQAQRNLSGAFVPDRVGTEGLRMLI